MRDEYDDRLWNDGRTVINHGIDRLIATIMQAFRVLHCIHWSAPWTDASAQDRHCRS
ncbi:hypothetical protein MOK15_06140 [Sphingobium sp. BYY-5]|uniref:hypothetical protein n=1 Tax=Sphingobium sp. BYY-5 TaxID=2926400 RepID=UPI001FA71CEC|nr:hypothetical protein [Sphingobium sp. BYY-5]MCI4589668.1 hypothetical protein [Sphingobium sp. BYY-5]